jgi:four helix bundle protein
MATITQLEDLKVWQKARALCKRAYALCKHPEFKSDPGFRQQILNSSGSVMDNIAEGFGRMDRKEFIQFLAIAEGSLSEFISQTYRAYDRGVLDEAEVQSILEEQRELSKMIKRLMNYLRQSEIKGNKYALEEQPDPYGWLTDESFTLLEALDSCSLIENVSHPKPQTTNYKPSH